MVIPRAIEARAEAPIQELVPEEIALEQFGLHRRTLLKDIACASGALALGGLDLVGRYIENHPEAAELRFDLLRSWIDPPKAPLTEADSSDLLVQKNVIPLYNGLITKFSTHKGLLLEANRDVSPWHYGEAWPYGRALDAVGAGRALPGRVGNECSRMYDVLRSNLELYWYDGPAGYDPGYLPGLRALTSLEQRYVDDNLWIGLALVRDFWQTGHAESLKRAKQIFELAMGQWDPKKGGIRWRQVINGDVTSKVLVANAPAAQLAMELFSITNNPRYYRAATKIMDWVDVNLQNGYGLYSDGIGDDFSIDPNTWSYGVGTVIGAKSKLNMIDPKRYPLEEIIATADIALDGFDEHHSLLWTPDAPLTKEDNSFNAIFMAEILNFINDHKLPADHPLTRKAYRKLQNCVNNLHKSPNATLLQHAGALHLAILAYLQDSDVKYTRF